MKIEKRGNISYLEIPYNGFHYMAQVAISFDGGKTWGFADSKFFKKKDEAIEYLKTKI